MRLLDADIFSYALYDEHVAHPYAWRVLERAIRGDIVIYVTHTTILETFNVLFWYYKVRPRTALLRKMKLVLGVLRVISPSMRGLDIAIKENIPLGDGLLIATAVDMKIPVILTNDSHIIKSARKYGIIVRNPIPKNIRELMGRNLN